MQKIEIQIDWNFFWLKICFRIISSAVHPSKSGDQKKENKLKTCGGRSKPNFLITIYSTNSMAWTCEWEYMCVRENVCVWERLCMCVWEREIVCVCVCKWFQRGYVHHILECLEPRMGSNALSSSLSLSPPSLSLFLSIYPYLSLSPLCSSLSPSFFLTPIPSLLPLLFPFLSLDVMCGICHRKKGRWRVLPQNFLLFDEKKKFTRVRKTWPTFLVSLSLAFDLWKSRKTYSTCCYCCCVVVVIVIVVV